MLRDGSPPRHSAGPPLLQLSHEEASASGCYLPSSALDQAGASHTLGTINHHPALYPDRTSFSQWFLASLPLPPSLNHSVCIVVKLTERK